MRSKRLVRGCHSEGNTCVTPTKSDRVSLRSAPDTCGRKLCVRMKKCAFNCENSQSVSIHEPSRSVKRGDGVLSPTSESIEAVKQFTRRSNVDFLSFDKLSASGRNGVFKCVTKADNKAENTCELCAPLETATIGVCCTGCQMLLDEEIAQILCVPVDLIV